jgi:hypothetical protein
MSATELTAPIGACTICGMRSVLDEFERCHACQRYAEGYDDGAEDAALAAVDAAVRVARAAGVGMQSILDHLDRTGGG